MSSHYINKKLQGKGITIIINIMYSKILFYLIKLLMECFTLFYIIQNPPTAHSSSDTKFSSEIFSPYLDFHENTGSHT